MHLTVTLPSKTELKEFWKSKFEKAPFYYMNKIFISKYYVYEKQKEIFGDLSNTSKKQLNKLILKYEKNKTISVNDIKKSKRAPFPVGTKLIREFKGKTHEVIILNDGYEYSGKIYKSLSAIANYITGTRWNGKVFFGVKNK